MMKLKCHFCYLILLFCLFSISGHEKQLQEEQEGDGGELKQDQGIILRKKKEKKMSANFPNSTIKRQKNNKPVIFILVVLTKGCS